MTNIDQERPLIQIRLEASEYTVPPGSQINIPITLINNSTNTDSFKLDVDGIPAAWVSTRSPLTLLLPGEKKQIQLIIQPPSAGQGSVGYYLIKVRAISQEFPNRVAEADLKLSVAAFEIQGRVGVLMSSTNFSVAPGSSVIVRLTLLNQGLVDDEFRLSFEGLPANWISLASAITPISAGEEREITFSISPPRDSSCKAGPYRFTLRVISQEVPDQSAKVDCTLTVAAFSAFDITLEPEETQSGESAFLTIFNKGNIQDSYQVNFASEEDTLLFEPEGPQQIRLQPGSEETFEFSARPRQRPLFGNVISSPYEIEITSAEGLGKSLRGEIASKALVPIWVLPVVLGICLIATCIAVYFSFLRPQFTTSPATQTAGARETSLALIVGATQTAAFQMTTTAGPVLTITPTPDGLDSDSDGLTDAEEIELGTDPFNPDTDGDQLSDGDEVKQFLTDPLIVDTDRDGLGDGEEVIQTKTDPTKLDTDGDDLSDGEEVLNRKTDPLKADTDDDKLNDGDEVRRRTDPLNPDTDRDGMNDGDEIAQGTDPLNPDSDNDRLLDGSESIPCPHPLNPDTDGDGIIDGIDLNPCDPNNPALTATALASIPTNTPVSPTVPPTPTHTQPPPGPDLRGRIAFGSSRDGNLEIYLYNAGNRTTVRLTNNPNVDTQPSISPNGARIAFVSNRSGNNDIWVMDIDGSDQINLTNNTADDQAPSWSPDGGSIVFQTNRDGNYEIYAMDTNGNNLRNLTNFPGGDDTQPNWFVGRLLLLTTGESIAFTSNRDGNLEIYTMDPDGSQQTNITNTSNANDFQPSAAPEGDRIVFTTDRDNNLEIYMMIVDGTMQQNLSNNGAEDQLATWSPDNRYIAFTTNRNGNQDIFVMDGNGNNQLGLIIHPAADNYPNWR